jgi:hypothetical protein
MLKKALIALLTAALIPLATSCDDETPDPVGDLQVTYRIGSGSTNCEDEGIVSVHIYLVQGTTNVTDEVVACDPDNQSVMFQDVAAGDYTVRAEGLNSDSAIIYTGEITEPITVEANATNGPENVILNQIAPTLVVYVDFADAGNCASFEVTEVTVVVYATGGSEQFRVVEDCATLTAGSVVVENLSESSTYDVRVRGAYANGEYWYEYNEDAIAVQPGVPTEIEAEMEACAAICEDP